MATPLSSPTAPGIYGAAPVVAQPNNGSTTPIPTTAPTGQTSTSSAPASPVAVASSNPAASYVNNTIAPALSSAQGAIATQTAAKTAAIAANPYSLQPGETPDAYNTRIAAYNASKNSTPSTPPTPEQQIADTPDTGNQWIYDSQGNRTQNPIGQELPVGYSTTNPNVGPTTPIVDQTTDPVGNVYKQFSDGTYGKYSPTGTYIGVANPSDFTNSKTGEGLLSSISQVANGSFPLTALQQAQVDGLKSQFAELITTQMTANANLTGGTTVAENLYGMGQSISGLGEIKGTIDSGIAKIADLNSQLASAVATMESGFQTDDMTLLKGAYDTYSQAVKDRQTELDTMQAAAQKALVDAQTAQRENDTLKLTKMMDDNTISYQQKQQELAQSTLTDAEKQQIIDNDFKQKTLDLDTRKEDFAESQASQSSEGAGNGLPQVGFTASGAADPVQQDQFLNSLPGGPTGAIATDVKGLADYSIDPTTFTVRTLKGGTQLTRDQYIAMAKQYNPNYNESNYAAAAKYNASFKSTTANSTGGQLAAANKGIVHFASLMDALAALKNPNVGGGITNAIRGVTQSGDQSSTGFQANEKSAQTLALGVSDELAKFFKGSGTVDAKSIADWQDSINVNLSPGSQQGLKDATIKLLTGQLDTAYSNYETAMGQPPPAPGQPGAILTPAAVAALKKIGIDTSPYDEGVQPYNTTTDNDFINSAPGNSGGGETDTADFFTNL